MIATLLFSIALLAGLFARQLSLPPLVGYLVAGFILPFAPELQSFDLAVFAHIGITLLLFSIGLKLDVRTLIKPHITGVASVHLLLVVGIISSALVGLKWLNWPLLDNVSFHQCVIIGFALSFSSTVFAVKALEKRGELISLHGKIAIGILIVQDIFAVLYLGFTEHKTPALYAPLVLLLIPMRPIFDWLLVRCGHGELLVLAGFALAFIGYHLFEIVGLKGDIGALFIGALLANSSKSAELSNTLLNFKDLLLVGFFLSIGQYGIPTLSIWLTAIILLLLIGIKPILYFLLLTKFKLRARTSFFSALTLSNYSEFGLIVIVMAADSGWVEPEWVVVMALLLSLSFVAGAIIEDRSHIMYRRYKQSLCRFQCEQPISGQQPTHLGNACILIFGMGRVGEGAFDYLQKAYGNVVVGIEENNDKADRQRASGRRVLNGDASDSDLWDQLQYSQIKLILLALSNHQETLEVIELIQQSDFHGQIAATARYSDEVKELKQLNVIPFNLYADAGTGFAEHVYQQIEDQGVHHTHRNESLDVF